MPSAASAAQRETQRLASLTFFLDHQIGRYQVAEALRAAGAKVEVHLDHFPGDTPDIAEPIFKLTVLHLDKDESPERAYGDRERDSYQDTQGIARSSRRIPADIPKSKIISSSIERIDPKKQLKEAGYPFDHIGTELINLHGKFETVSADVRVMKEEFTQKTAELSTKIEKETNTLSTKIDETKNNLLESADILFDRKFLRTTGLIIGALPVLYGAAAFLEKSRLGGDTIAVVAIIVGLLIWAGAYVVTKK